MKEEMTNQVSLGNANGERTSQKGVLKGEFQVMLHHELGSGSGPMTVEMKERDKDKERERGRVGSVYVKRSRRRRETRFE